MICEKYPQLRKKFGVGIRSENRLSYRSFNL
jgi:hypothetical protein